MAARSASSEVGALLAALWFSDENHQRFHEACSVVGLTPPQLKALQSLDPHEARSMRALADQWSCDASWVTGIVDGLEQAGLVERRAVPTDRRVKTVVLTDLGMKAQARANEVLNRPPAAIATLTRDEQRALRDLLRKLVDASA